MENIIICVCSFLFAAAMFCLYLVFCYSYKASNRVGKEANWYEYTKNAQKCAVLSMSLVILSWIGILFLIFYA